jgi:tRNA threonylcarbamoyladenosine biosynthesis protein TsaB
MTGEDCRSGAHPPGWPEMVLAVHSSGASLGVAIICGEHVVGELVLPPARGHLERLAPAIESLAERLPGGVRDIDAFAVARGPGSFSGIRVGMATVKGMALALGKPLRGISSLEILARQGLEPSETGISLIDARRGELFAEAFTRSGDRLISLGEPRLVAATKLDVFAAQFVRSLVICADAAVPTLPVPVSNASRYVSLSASPVVCAYLGCEQFRHGASDELHTVVPLYIRRSDAEEKKRP